MFRDGSMNSLHFQKKVQYFKFVYSCTEKNHSVSSTSISKNKRAIDRNILHQVPTIDFLREQVNLCTDGMHVKRVRTTPSSWNSMFHHIVKICASEPTSLLISLILCLRLHILCFVTFLFLGNDVWRYGLTMLDFRIPNWVYIEHNEIGRAHV